MEPNINYKGLPEAFQATCEEDVAYIMRTFDPLLIMHPMLEQLRPTIELSVALAWSMGVKAALIDAKRIVDDAAGNIKKSLSNKAHEDTNKNRV